MYILTLLLNLLLYSVLEKKKIKQFVSVLKVLFFFSPLQMRMRIDKTKFG